MGAKPACWQEYAQALQENGQTIFVKQSVPLEVYYGIANSLLTEAAICRKKHDLPELYIVLIRLANLRAEGIPTHQDYNNTKFSHQRAYFRKVLLKNVLPELEDLRPELQRRMERLKTIDRLRHFQPLPRVSEAWPSPSKEPAEEPVSLSPSSPTYDAMPAGQRDSPRDSPRDTSRATPRATSRAPVPPSTPRNFDTGPRFYSRSPSWTPPVVSSALPSEESSLPAREETSSNRPFLTASDGCRQSHTHEPLPEKAFPRKKERLKPELRLCIPERKEFPVPPWDPYALLPMSDSFVEVESPSRGMAVPDNGNMTPLASRELLGVKGNSSAGSGLGFNRISSQANTLNCKPVSRFNRHRTSNGRSSPDLLGFYRPYSSSSSDSDVDHDVANVRENTGWCVNQRVPGPEVKPSRQHHGLQNDCGSKNGLAQVACVASPLSRTSGPLILSRNIAAERKESAAIGIIDRWSASLQYAYEQELTIDSNTRQQQSEEAGHMIQCSICFDEFSSEDCVTARIAAQPDDAAGKEAQGSATWDADERVPCSHWHCVDCLRQYATLKVLETRTSRIVCTSTGCPGLFLFEDVGSLLGQKERDVYTTLLAEDMMTCKVYCPFDDCNTVMECAEDERGPDSTCAVCQRAFCRDCSVAWHHGQTCEDYLSAKEDGPLHELANKHNWKSCPKCKHMIERREGCNYVQCKCGCGFCYKCGTAYKSGTRTSRNPHGNPGCICML